MKINHKFPKPDNIKHNPKKNKYVICQFTSLLTEHFDLNIT